MEILEKLKIGTLHADDVAALATKNAAADSKDPYSQDPDLSPLLIQHMSRPTNAEAPAPLLAEEWITPPGLFFVRNHHPVPVIDERAYGISIDFAPNVTPPGAGAAVSGKGKSFTMSDLKNPHLFPKHTVVSTIQCGGNRRREMNSVPGKGKTNGCAWQGQAISTAEWGGVRMRDVLLSLGVDEEAAARRGIKHVILVGAEGTLHCL